MIDRTFFYLFSSDAAPSLSLSAPPPPHNTPPPQPAQAEIYGALCLGFFALNYVLGRRRNSRLAAEVCEALRPVLEAQFAHVGAGPVVEEDAAASAPASSSSQQQQLLLRESPHEFLLWASGRRNLGDPGAGSGALFRLKLRPRQDAVSTVLAVAEGLPDQLEVTLPLPRGGDKSAVPVALAVGRPGALREAVEDFDDLRRLTKGVSPSGAPAKNLPWWPTAAAIDVNNPSLSAASESNIGGLAAVSDSVQALADVVASGPLGPALAASARASLASPSGRVILSPRPRLRLLRLSGDGCLRTRGAGSPVLTAVVDLPALGAAVLATADAVAVYGGRAAATGTPAAGLKVMTAEARSKALALRAAASKAAAAGEDAGAGGGSGGGDGTSAAAAQRLEAKRLAAKEAEKAKLASMSSEAKEKYLLKKQRIEQKRLMKRRTVRG